MPMIADIDYSMAQWASWLYNEAPLTCWGSHDKVQRWLNP